MSFKNMGWACLQGLGIIITNTISFYPNHSVAQITPDGTLANNSNIRLEDNTRVITGGTQAGSNLFHSFKNFSVPTGSEAFFNNNSNIQNIISRVTGGSISNIDGLIRANGSANLFLMNPNGIVFGPNARLSLGGSFFGTSANSMEFSDGSEFSAVNPQSPPLLTINVPLGLQLGTNSGSIRVEGNGEARRTSNSPIIDTQDALRVQPDKTLALVGGDIELEGATLKTAGGRIELGSVAGNGLVGLTPNNKGFALDYGGVENFGDIRLSQRANVDASGEGAGDVKVQSRRLSLTDGSRIETSTLGASEGGNLVVNATESVEIIGAQSALATTVYPEATGNAGDISITTNSLEVINGARVDTSTFGQGDAGSITINANGLVKFDGETQDELFPSGAFSTVRPGAVGNGGSVSITTDSLEVINGARVNTSTFGQGDAGIVTINANDLVEFDGKGQDELFTSGAFSTVRPGAVGNGGYVSISTASLKVTNGARVDAGTVGQGNAGSVTINANDLVKFDGKDRDGTFPSGAFSVVFFGAVGNAGDVSISTGSLEVTNSAQIAATTLEQGDAGSVTINANDLVKFDGQSSGAFSGVSPNAVGNAGGVLIDTTSLEITNGARLDASSFGHGNAGDLNIQAKSIHLDNDGTIATETQSANNDIDNTQANINIQSRYLILRRGSNITANATAENVIGGNININTKLLAGFEDSNITASNIVSNNRLLTGNVNIKTESLFGMRFRDADSPLTSDITVTGTNSELSVDLDDVDIGLVKIPGNLVDASNQIYDPCIPGDRGFGNSFVSVGRGGLPMTPTEPLQDTSTISTWVRLKPQPPSKTNKKTSSQPITTAKTPKVEKLTEVEQPTQIVEATGWIVNENGDIEFVAQASHTSPKSPWQNPPSCSASQRGVKHGISNK